MKLQECFFHVNARPLTESEVLCDVLFFLPFHGEIKETVPGCVLVNFRAEKYAKTQTQIS